jgi:hypothetical protein
VKTALCTYIVLILLLVMWVRECTVHYLHLRVHAFYKNLSKMDKNTPIQEALTVNYYITEGY